MKEGLNFSSSYNSKTKKLEQGLTPEELSALENYVSSWSKNVTKNELNEWSEKTLFQKLIYIFVTDYIGEFVDFDPPDDLHFSLEDDDKVNDHIGNLEKKCLKKLIKIVGKEPTYSSFDNFFKDVLNEFFSSLAGIHGKDFHWFKFDRWRNKKIKDFWINKGYIDNPTSFKGIDLYSPGHKQLCERLEQAGVMFFFEAPCFLLGDQKQYRRIDLVVVSNNRAVIVEVDGGSHRKTNQQKDDYERERLIRKHFSNTLRFEHGYVIEHTDECFYKIMESLNPSRGMIS